MARRSTIKGAASFRRLLKALPDSANRQIITFLGNAGVALQQQMRAQLPVLQKGRPNRTPGALRDSISYRVTPTTLNLKVGQLNKRTNAFYGHILDVGRKAKVVHPTRGKKNYPNGMKISPLAPLYVITKTKVSFRTGTLPGYRTLMDQILLDASQGVGDD